LYHFALIDQPPPIMLDLNKVAKQLPKVGAHLTKEAQAGSLRMQLATRHFETALKKQTELQQQQEQWRSKLRFGSAAPIEDLSTCKDIPNPPAKHTVLATDGSQIAPSHHEIAYCYLINVGRVMIHYGQSLQPLLDSVPDVFYLAADLYESRKWGIDTEEWMGNKRTVAEATVLADLGYDWVNPPFGVGEDEPPQPARVPMLAMVDGSLVYRFMEELPTEARTQLLDPMMEAWEKLRSIKVPMVSYLSASRSIDTLNFLRLLSCTFPEPDCISHCAQEDRPPCQVFDGLRDTSLWLDRLQPGQRGCLWQSKVKTMDFYPPEQRIYFCYLNVGAELARVEMPEWVATDPEMLDQALGIVLSQVQKGQGYPVAIAEAHNFAVVRGADRTSFFSLLEREMVKAGLKNVGVSYKERRKRVSIA
jgi:NurA domain